MFEAFSILKIKAYRNYQIGRLFFILGLQIQVIVLSIYAYHLTKDPLTIGLIGLSEAISFILFALISGNLADRYNRKKIILISTSIYWLCSIGLLILILLASSINQSSLIKGIYFIIFITGIARSFFSPAQGALLSQLVPKSMYPQSATFGSIIWNTGTIAGPAIGGLLFAYVGIENSFYILISLITLGILFFINVDYKHEAVVISESTMVRIKEGFKFVLNNQILWAAMLIDMLAVLFGGAVALIPVFADKILHVDAVGIGWLRAAPSIGAVLCSVYIAYNPITKNAGKWFLANIFLFGICMFLFGISKNYLFSFIILLLSGAFDNISVIIRSLIYQLFTPNEMRGRVLSINYIFIGSSNEIGSFESGLASKLFGLVNSVVAGSIITMGVCLSTLKIAPKLVQLDFTEHNK